MGTSPEEDATARMACTAYCLYVFGRRYCLPGLIAQSRKTYCSCLASLYRAKWSADNALAILTTICWIGMIEQLELKDPTAWVKHELGKNAFLATLDPKTFASTPNALALFEYLRPIVTLTCIMVQQPCILQTPLWMNVPWSKFATREKSLDQTMIDIILRYLPSMLEQVGMIRVNGDADEEKTAKEIVDIWIAFRSAFEELRQWRMENSSFLKVVDCYTTGGDHDQIFTNRAPIFSSAIALIYMTWYYAMVTMLYLVAAEVCVVTALRLSGASESFDQTLRWIVQTESENVACFPMLFSSGEDEEEPEHRSMWLAIGESMLENAHTAAHENCKIIVPAICGEYEEVVTLYARTSLFIGSNTLGTGAVGGWAKKLHQNLFIGSLRHYED